MDGAPAGAESLWPSVIRWKPMFSILEWPVPPCRKKKYVPIVPNRARTHVFPSLWGTSMNERCPPVIIPGMHHSPSGRFLIIGVAI
jgi:hypothetical protein